MSERHSNVWLLAAALAEFVLARAAPRSERTQAGLAQRARYA